MWPWLLTLTYFCKTLTLPGQTYTKPFGALPDFVSILVAFPLHLSSWNYTQTPHESRMCPIEFGVKGQGHNALITEISLNGIIAFPLHYHLETSHKDSPWVGDVPYWVPGQRSRLQWIDYWNPFMSHNCFPFTPTIMTLHTRTLHELRMCPIDFRLKRSKVKVTMHWLLKKVFDT